MTQLGFGERIQVSRFRPVLLGATSQALDIVPLVAFSHHLRISQNHIHF
jgi:hypothetical protein